MTTMTDEGRRIVARRIYDRVGWEKRVRRAYRANHPSTDAMAAELDVNVRTVRRWLAELGLNRPVGRPARAR